MNNPQPWWLTWPVAEVAAAILPLFSSFTDTRSGARLTFADEHVAMSRIVSWFRTGSPTGANFPMRRRGFCGEFDDPDYRAVAEAMQVLESTRLLMRALVQASATSYLNVGLTRLGWHALQTNTVRQHLGLGDTPPTG